MSAFYAATVTIGRNVTVEDGQRPMGNIRWAAFRAFVRRVLITEGLAVTAQNLGHGSWEGVEEENCVTVGVYEHKNLADLDADEARRAPEQVRLAIAGYLSAAAGVYKQQSIAFAWGPSDLIGGA